MRTKNRLLILLALLLCGFTTTWAVQKVTIAPTQNGEVTFSPATPVAGDQVTLTVTPAEGYKIAKSDIVAELTIDPGSAQAPSLMDQQERVMTRSVLT